MSHSSTEDLLAAARVVALENFALFDREAVSLNIPSAGELNRLKPGSAIIITGFIPFHAVRFAINLVCVTPKNVALHFNPRLDRNYVVRNSMIRGRWQQEETSSPPGPNGYLFQRNSYFHIMIFCTANEYQIAIDGEHFCAFTYRIPLEEVNGIEVDGNVEDLRTRQTYLYVYPDPKLCRPSRNLQLDEEFPLTKDLGLPATVALPNGYRNGSQIFIKGKLKLLPHSFYVNLQKGNVIYPHPEIALHLNPRFHFGTEPPCVIMNCWTDGSWMHEERHESLMSWGPGRDFFLEIRCEYESYTIWLDKKMICEFKHRISPTIVDTIRLYGDINLQELSMSYT